MSDAVVDERLRALREQSFNAALGSRKTWRLLNTAEPALRVARCTVERRMRALGMVGIGPGRPMRTTRPAACSRQPEDLVRRDFTAEHPNQRWVVDVRLHPHLVRVLLHGLRDGASTRAGSWGGRPPAGRGTDFVLSALEQAVWQRKDCDGRSLAGLVHHSDHGSKSPVHQVHRSSPE